MTSSGEEWKGITGYATFLVSNLGNVMSCLTGPVAQLVNKYGYYVVQLRLGRRIKYVHRLVATYFLENTDPENKTKVDHINRDKLDNRVTNLRYASEHENCLNKGKIQKTTTSRYKGVYLDKRTNKWRASIGYNRKKYYLGAYANEDDAARAYNEKATEFFKEFAYLNIIG